MTKQLKYILLLLIVFSCKSNSIDKPKKPDNLISKDKMTEIIYDISLINSAKGVNKKLIENEGIIPVEYIYTKHNIDSLQFVLSNEYAYSVPVNGSTGLWSSFQTDHSVESQNVPWVHASAFAKVIVIGSVDSG